MKGGNSREVIKRPKLCSQDSKDQSWEMYYNRTIDLGHLQAVKLAHVNMGTLDEESMSYFANLVRKHLGMIWGREAGGGRGAKCFCKIKCEKVASKFGG